MRPRRPFVAWARHPLTRRRFRVTGRTDRELQANLYNVDSLRLDYQHGRRSAADVDRAVRRLVHGAVTLERIATSYKRSAAPNTRRRIESFIAASGASLCGRELLELDKETVAAWLDALRAQDYAPSTLGTAWRTLSSLGRHAIARGWIGTFPWGDFRPARLRSAPRLRESARTLDELERLFAAARMLDASRGWPSMVLAKIVTIALLGLRQGELAGLRWGDVDAERGTVTIERQYAGAPLKNRRPGRLAAAPLLFSVLQEHASTLEHADLFTSDGPLFPSPRFSAPGAPRPIASGAVLTRAQLRTTVRLAGLPHAERWAPTSLRDSFATLETAAAGGDLRRLSERTRHASLSSLAKYLRARTREPAPPGFSPALASDAPALLSPHKNARR